MVKNSKILSAAALITAFAMIAAGCSSNGESDSGSGESSVSVNVIGGPDSSEAMTAPDGAVIVTDEEGNAETGVGGNVLTEPANTEPAPADTLSEDDILSAMSATTAAPQLDIPRTNTERYGYSTLTADEKKLYDDIVAGIEGLRYKICEEDAYSLEEWAKIYGMVRSLYTSPSARD